MLEDAVLVRAIRGEPAKLIAVAAAHGLIYVANPASLQRVRDGLSWPVGVPEEDVFAFDYEVFERLRQLWGTAERLDRDVWRQFKLVLYRPTGGAIAA